MTSVESRKMRKHIAQAALLWLSLTGASMADESALSVSATVKDANTQLDVSWVVTNRSDKPVWALLTPVRHNDKPASDSVYLGMGTDGVAELALKAFAVPAGTSAAALDKIGAVVIAPGQQVAGSGFLPYPLQTRQPYRPAQPLKPDVGQARLCVGYLPVDSAIPISTRQANGAPVTYHEARVADAQRLACSPVVSWR